MNTPDPTSATDDTHLKNRLLRHLDACLKEIDSDIHAIDKRYENHENFNVAVAMREMNAVKDPHSSSDVMQQQHNKISTFNSDLTMAAAALNLSMNSSTTAVSDQDENNNGTDDNTFESSSSFHSTRSEQQQQSHHDIETSSSSLSSKRATVSSSKSDKRHFSECVGKTDERGLSPATKKPRPKVTTVIFTLLPAKNFCLSKFGQTFTPQKLHSLFLIKNRNRYRQHRQLLCPPLR